MEMDIKWLKTENQNQREEIHLLKKQYETQKQEIDHLRNQKLNQQKETLQMKSPIEYLIDLQYGNYSAINQTTNTTSFGIANKRTVRAVPSESAEMKTNHTDTTSTSWAKLEISDRVIGYMDYDTYTVKIFDHALNKDVNMKNEKKKYYFEPIGQLNHLSAESSYNNVSKKYEMTFNVNMWDDAVRDAVYKFISEDMELGPVNKNFVRVLPLDNVAMMYNEIGPASPHFEINQNWIDYKSDKYLTFKFICDRMKPCNDLAMQMKSNPKQFPLKMRFSVSSQNSQTRDTKINIESILHGDMMNKLDQIYKKNNTEKELVLLTAEGKKQLMKESSENIIIQTIDDGTEVPSQKSKNEIYNKLEKMLEFSRTTIQKGDEGAWENVFWNEDNYRPDKSARTLSDIHKTLDQENKNKLESAVTSRNKIDVEAGVNAWAVGAHAKFGKESSGGGSSNQENIAKLLNDAKDRVEWDGEKFVPKEMTLYSFNIAKLTDKKAFTDTNIRVSYRTSMLSIDVRYDSSLDPSTSSELFKLGIQFSSK